MKIDQDTVKVMVSFYKERREAGDSDLEFLPFIKNNPNAYLLGVIYNQGMSADRVWLIPQTLAKRLGHLDASRMATEDIRVLENALHRHPALHRYWKTMASYTQSAAEFLVERYKGLATNIWNDKPTVSTLYERLTEFKGIGPKKANMAIRALALAFDVPLADPHNIDLPVDIHVRRVFLRTGLAKSDSAQEMIQVARRTSPSLPAELDLPSWLIGRRWCHATDPDCENCVLTGVCRKITEITVKGN